MLCPLVSRHCVLPILADCGRHSNPLVSRPDPEPPDTNMDGRAGPGGGNDAFLRVPGTAAECRQKTPSALAAASGAKGTLIDCGLTQ